MLGQVYSGVLQGVDGRLVRVEADAGPGLPYFEMVGFLSSEVKEARERVRTALRNSRIELPSMKITVSLSPANVRKSGNYFDVPVAAAVLAAIGGCKQAFLHQTMMVGELGLDGSVRSVPGILPLVLEARERGVDRCVVPQANIAEASVVQGIQVIGIKELEELIDMLRHGYPEGMKNGRHDSKKAGYGSERSISADMGPDFSEINGQVFLRRATEIAAAGMHNILYIGPPGAGKSMTARRIPGILPEMSLEEKLELTRIYSARGLLLPGQALMEVRPFRAPHYSASRQAVIGGGRIPVPGEISLAHRGVLFLDELPEFDSGVLESLRQPMEDGEVVLSRIYGSYRFPARAMVVAAMNPCRCGFYPDRSRCHCRQEEVHSYLRKISRPFLERMDMHLMVERPAFEEMSQEKENESSAVIRQRVSRCCQIQRERYAGEPDLWFNSQLNGRSLQKYCALGREEHRMAAHLYEQLEMSARTYGKLLKVARTIADLEGEERILCKHLGEAVSYRMADREFWGGVS